MVRINHIFIGWAKKWGWLPTSEAEEKLRELRLRICSECPDSKVSPVLKLITPGEMDFVDTIYCTRCSCPCDAKARVVAEQCPIKKW